MKSIAMFFFGAAVALVILSVLYDGLWFVPQQQQPVIVGCPVRLQILTPTASFLTGPTLEINEFCFRDECITLRWIWDYRGE